MLQGLNSPEIGGKNERIPSDLALNPDDDSQPDGPRGRDLALRQQLAILKQKTKIPKLRPQDRVFWVWLSKLWPNWRSVLVIVQPSAVVRWHHQGFKLYWRWKSRSKKAGWPPIWREIRDLVRRMCRENPTWGAPRIQSELHLLGYDVAETTIDKYMIRDHKPPSPTW